MKKTNRAIHAVYSNHEILFMFKFIENMLQVLNNKSVELINGNREPVRKLADIIQYSRVVNFANNLSPYGHDVFVIYIKEKRVASIVFNHGENNFKRVPSDNAQEQRIVPDMERFHLTKTIIHDRKITPVLEMIMENTLEKYLEGHNESLSSKVCLNIIDDASENEMARIDALDNPDKDAIISVGEKLTPLYENGFKVFYLNGDKLLNMKTNPNALEAYSPTGRLLIVSHSSHEHAFGCLRVGDTGIVSLLNNVWKGDFNIWSVISKINGIDDKNEEDNTPEDAKETTYFIWGLFLAFWQREHDFYYPKSVEGQLFLFVYMYFLLKEVSKKDAVDIADGAKALLFYGHFDNGIILFNRKLFKECYNFLTMVYGKDSDEIETIDGFMEKVPLNDFEAYGRNYTICKEFFEKLNAVKYLF